MRIIHLEETDSTNNWLRSHADHYSPHETVAVWASKQTAGRGCGSNTWESEAGKNLLFSVLCHPKLTPANQQFSLLEAMALAVKETIDDCLPKGDRLTIKWPNDIYWHDSKLGGTLTECAVSGQYMRWCIIGTGLNINQLSFTAQLPNPVSLAQVTGSAYKLEPLLLNILARFEQKLRLAESTAGTGSQAFAELHTAYTAALYRSSGYHPYRDAQGTFEAQFMSVAPDGTLTLSDRNQQLRQYKFKEVQFLILHNETT